MAVYPFQFVNRRGSAAISTSGVTVNTDNVVFSFPNHAFVNAWYRGTIYIDLAQAVPTGTTGTLPVLFETNGGDTGRDQVQRGSADGGRHPRYGSVRVLVRQDDKHPADNDRSSLRTRREESLHLKRNNYAFPEFKSQQPVLHTP